MSARKRERRAAWRARLRERAQLVRAASAAVRRLMIADALGGVVARAAVIELMQTDPFDGSADLDRRTIRELRRYRLSRSFDRLESRARWLAPSWPMRVFAMSQERLRVIIATSTVVRTTALREQLQPVVWSDAGISLALRVRAARGAR